MLHPTGTDRITPPPVLTSAADGEAAGAGGGVQGDRGGGGWLHPVRGIRIDSIRGEVSADCMSTAKCVHVCECEHEYEFQCVRAHVLVSVPVRMCGGVCASVCV